MKLNDLIKDIKESNHEIKKEAEEKINFKTKPLGSLGLIEEAAVKMSEIQNSLNPVIKNKQLLIFAGDHGIVKSGVSAFPQEVTSQMVFNFLAGGAAINVLARHNNIDIKIIDAGVNYDFKNNPAIINKKISLGTKNFLFEPAMTKEEAEASIQNGIDVFIDINKKNNIDILLVGEMGIGNTTPSSAIISCITGVSPEKTTGKGTGLDKEKFKNKITIIKKALKFHKPEKSNAIDILSKVGGFEIGGIAGAILAASYFKKPVIIDGVISTTGALLSYLLNPIVKDYLFASHRSVEIGQKAALDFLGLNPLLDLSMRLGEGTGSALAVNIIEASCKIMCEMASFKEAGVSNKEN